MWLNPKLAAIMVVTIADVFAEKAPENAALFDANANHYIHQLNELDAWAMQKVATIPAKSRVLIGYHDNLRYFGDRYGLIAPDSILGRISTEHADPSPKAFAELAELIQHHKIPAVFGENIASLRLPEQLARQSQLPPPVALITGALTPDSGHGSTYLQMMRYNVSTVVEKLGGSLEKAPMPMPVQ